MSRYTAQEKTAILRELAEGTPTQLITNKYGVSRISLYLWKRQLATKGHLENRFIKGKEHYRSLSQETIEQVLVSVKANPQDSVANLHQKLLLQGINVSYYAVQKILERYNLRTVEDRLIYSQQAIRTTIQPVQIESQIAPKPAFLENRQAAGPPVHATSAGLNSPLRLYVSIFLVAFFLTFIFTFGLANAFLHAENTTEAIAFFCALVALMIGIFFFAYSLKYYFSIASILLFSRNLDNVEKETKDAFIANRFSSQLFKPPGLLRLVSKAQITGMVPNVSAISLSRHPFVSIHLPLFNEKRVVNRLLEAITSLDYDNFEVIVCDDSTDETTTIVMEWANHPKVKISHRQTREGFKGGALKHALTLMDPRTEFVIVFDADFLPYPDTIDQFLKYFMAATGTLDPQPTQDNPLGYQTSPIAAIQGYQWHVLNKSENWITRGVRTEYAGSYVIERSGIEIYGGLKQIAGSVFMVRADIIKNPRYNWGVSLTEDFELTLKLYHDGYKVIYTPYVQAPSECVSTMKRLIRQRMRWAEGHSFNIKKMWQAIALSKQMSFFEKLEFAFLSPYYLQSLFLIVGTSLWFVSEALFKVRLPFWTEVWGWSLVLTNLFALPLMNTVGLFLEEAEEKDYSGIPSFILLSYILAPFQAYASVKGFLEPQEGPWFRTPKTGKITDIYKRGKFYRWLKGIISFPAFQNRVITSPIANASFVSTQRRYHQRSFSKRFIGRTLTGLVLSISIIVNLLVPSIPFYPQPQAFAFSNLTQLGESKTTNSLNLTNSVPKSNNPYSNTGMVTVFNPQSHPNLGGNWVVDFETKGKGELVIELIDETTQTALDFVSLTCGDLIVEPIIGIQKTLRISNWQCNQTAQLSHRVLEQGDHMLRFKFAGETALAFNQTTVDTSTSNSATIKHHQRKTWWDGSRYWVGFRSLADTRMEFWYSTDGSSWTENTSAQIAVSTADFSVEADSSTAYIIYTSGVDVVARSASSYPGTSFSWSAATTVLDGTSGVNDYYSFPVIVKDTDGQLWVGAQHTTATANDLVAIESTTANDITAWGSLTIVGSSSSLNNLIALVPLNAGDMYAVFRETAAIEGCFYDEQTDNRWEDSSGNDCTNGASQDAIVTGVNAGDKFVSALSDTTNYDVHMVTSRDAAPDEVTYYRWDNGSGTNGVWQSGVNLDANGNESQFSISIDTDTRDLYVLYVDVIQSDIFYRWCDLSAASSECSTSGDWAAEATLYNGSNVNNITSNYSGAGRIFVIWIEGSASPYSVVWESVIVPERLGLLLGFAPLIPFLIKRKKRTNS